MTLRKRFDYATELREFARQVEALALADRRDPEAPIVSKVDLAQRMHRRAAEVMRHDDPAERGTFRAETVFGPRGGRQFVQKSGARGGSAPPDRMVKLP